MPYRCYAWVACALLLGCSGGDAASPVDGGPADGSPRDDGHTVTPDLIGETTSPPGETSCSIDCTGHCGGEPDGCGGLCPDPCAPGRTCLVGVCTPECVASCAGRCSGESDGCGGACPDPCSTGQTCADGVCSTACIPSCATACAGDADGCGGICPNPCSAGQDCDAGICSAICVPDCTGQCGGDADGCGGTCASPCGPAFLCDAGACISPCTPDCSAACGGDPTGCGGNCPDPCPGGHDCSEGNCTPLCTPSCIGKCGGAPDGCGGLCPNPCSEGTACTAGTCDGGCTPDCKDKCAGEPSGCGGGCPSPCPGDALCFLGTCAACTPACADACAGEADGCGGICPNPCGPDQVCSGGVCGSVCTPSCAGKCAGEPTGCGGVCPDLCGPDDACAAGICTPCLPSCAGKCGGAPDGCGGICPSPCSATESCAAGICSVAAGKSITVTVSVPAIDGIIGVGFRLHYPAGKLAPSPLISPVGPFAAAVIDAYDSGGLVIVGADVPDPGFDGPTTLFEVTFVTLPGATLQASEITVDAVEITTVGLFVHPGPLYFAVTGDGLCTPDCSAACAGAPNGCGGICPDPCGISESCNAGVCGASCQPNCSAACKDDDDGCGGLCPDPCAIGEACAAGICTPASGTNFGVTVSIGAASKVVGVAFRLRYPSDRLAPGPTVMGLGPFASASIDYAETIGSILVAGDVPTTIAFDGPAAVVELGFVKAVGATVGAGDLVIDYLEITTVDGLVTVVPVTFEVIGGSVCTPACATACGGEPNGCGGLCPAPCAPGYGCSAGICSLAPTTSVTLVFRLGPLANVLGIGFRVSYPTALLGSPTASVLGPFATATFEAHDDAGTVTFGGDVPVGIAEPADVVSLTFPRKPGSPPAAASDFVLWAVELTRDGALPVSAPLTFRLGDPACTPSCATSCGGTPDGCGGLCPSPCGFGASCTQGNCSGGCTPSCASSCGGTSDGCGGMCPNPCPEGHACTAGVCSLTCVPSCDASAGGDADSCGGTCPNPCAPGQTCTKGQCTGTCVPDCTMRCAGDADGCGGACPNACAPGATCTAGLCTLPPVTTASVLLHLDAPFPVIGVGFQLLFPPNKVSAPMVSGLGAFAAATSEGHVAAGVLTVGSDVVGNVGVGAGTVFHVTFTVLPGATGPGALDAGDFSLRAVELTGDTFQKASVGLTFTLTTGICLPACAETCGGGADGCGGLCQNPCGAGATCATGLCSLACKPSCAGSCGGTPDGCGGTCENPCSGQGLYCTAGQCSSVCTPSCAGKCGGEPNGCGEFCADPCLPGQACAAGQCSGACLPDCKSACSGADDGCGGLCPDPCAPGYACASGLCVAPKPTRARLRVFLASGTSLIGVGLTLAYSTSKVAALESVVPLGPLASAAIEGHASAGTATVGADVSAPFGPPADLFELVFNLQPGQTAAATDFVFTRQELTRDDLTVLGYGLSYSVTLE